MRQLLGAAKRFTNTRRKTSGRALDQDTRMPADLREELPVEDEVSDAPEPPPRRITGRGKRVTGIPPSMILPMDEDDSDEGGDAGADPRRRTHGHDADDENGDGDGDLDPAIYVPYSAKRRRESK